MKEKLTLLICSCDAYEDLWVPFFTLLKKFWSSIECRIILNTESKQFYYDGLSITFINQDYDFKKATYGERMIRHLSSIDTEYTLLMLDDFFIRRPVDEKLLSRYITLMDSNPKIASIYFTPTLSGKEYYLDNSLLQLDKYVNYKLNTQGAIWRTKTLLSYWKPEDNPWKWESFASYTAYDRNDIFLEVKSYVTAPIYYGFKSEGMGVYRGKWCKEDVEQLFKQHGIDIDFTKRGFYSIDTAKPVFKNKISMLPYIFSRIGVKYTLGIMLFYLQKRIYKIFNLSLKYINYPAKLQAKNKK